MDEVKRNAILSQTSCLRLKIIDLQSKFEKKKLSEEEYNKELLKVSEELDLLEETIKCKELPKDYQSTSKIEELDIVDYLSKHTIETNSMEHDGKTSQLEIQARRFKEQGITEFLEWYHNNLQIM